MIKILLKILIIALALLAIDQIVPGIDIANFYTAFIVAVLWGIIGVTLKPVLHLLALPITILTLGLFAFVINALLFWFLSSFVAGFIVSGFLPALLGSLLLTVVNWVLHKFL